MPWKPSEATAAGPGMTGWRSWAPSSLDSVVCFRTLAASQPGTQRLSEALPPSPPRPGPPRAVHLVTQASRVLVCCCERRNRTSEERGMRSRKSGVISEALWEDPRGW